MHRRTELLDIIKQIRSKGMVFFIFSTADTHWPELHNFMHNGENPIEETVQKATRYRCKDLINNPHIVV